MTKKQNPTDDAASAAARLLGRKGGKAGTGKAKARTSEQARKAALARWAKDRANRFVWQKGDFTVRPATAAELQRVEEIRKGHKR